MREMWAKCVFVLIAAVLVANPVLACCFASAPSTEPALAQIEKPPCHGAASAEERSESKTTPAELPCPDCTDCTSVMMAMEITDDMTAVVSIDDELDLEVRLSEPHHTNAIAAEADHKPVPHLINSAETPVSLKQKLLI